MIDAGICGSKVKIPDSRGAHVTLARTEVSNSKMLSVICLDEIQSLRWIYTSQGVPVKAWTNYCGDYLAIAIAQRQRV